jgi:polyhydroxyalkanoic acid synthase PhaR subunit
VTQKPFFDPFEVWKSIYDKTEEKWSEVLQETMLTEGYSELMGQVQNGYLQYHELIQKGTNAYLKQVNMPSREEVSSIASLIINVEEKVDNLDQRIEDELLTNQADEIAKLKGSISKLDKKIDMLLKAVQQNAEATPVTTSVQNK